MDVGMGVAICAGVGMRGAAACASFAPVRTAPV
jgi:hypothetical protein